MISRGKLVGIGLYLVATFGLSVAISNAQTRGRNARVPEPEDIVLTTKDNVRLGATYYRSTMGKEAVPIVLIHDYKEGRTVFNALARALQAPSDSRLDSHAVLSVDLRGHGTSTSAIDQTGQTITIDPARFKPVDFEDMVRFDMEAVRKFLVEKNDSQELNINKLCLIGTGMGANVATIWAAVDWAAPPLAQRKQGQDVKALVLVSPIWRQKGLPLVNALKQPDLVKEVSVMIIYGSENSRAKQDAENVFNNFERYHPDPPIDQVRELKDLFEYPLPTTLQGSKLLIDPRFKMLAAIDSFLKARLSDKSYKWISRGVNE
ncbi:alpha/beta hydrolase [Bythopirellula polymerisocia]|uniref:Alpha/beta hydrolase family protein n=1 Tax=Bythopirellula polymerisocia TaxID=2528003 RepID=A0A5C6CK46_9BACT|nr:alpha/beta fold hydrolase [Bythopirellula polymerisocia]TWU23814.1 Alpha/beta hydrolase family protein [Bythopirellula polymerisocia]